MLNANEMREIADKSNVELHQKQLPNIEAALESVVFETEENIRRRAHCGEYSALTPDLLFTLRAILGSSMPTSVKEINELVTTLSDKLIEYFFRARFFSLCHSTVRP